MRYEKSTVPLRSRASGRVPSSRASRGGFSLIEILVVLFVIGVLAVIVTPAAAKMIRRARGLSAISTVTRVLSKARLLSVQRGFNVCVSVAALPANPDYEMRGKPIQLTMWEDRNPDFKQGQFTYTTDPDGSGPLPPVTNTADEVALGTTQIESFIRLGMPGGTLDDLASNALFDAYTCPDGVDRPVIAFTPTGGVVPPVCGSCGIPTPAGGRGIYFQDPRGLNYFRVTFPSNLSGKPREEMFITPIGSDTRNGYYPASWVWR